MSDQVPEPIEKITDKTVIGCMPVNGAQRIKIYPLDLNPSIRTMLLSSTEKDAKIKELEEKLEEALETLEELKWCYHSRFWKALG